MPVLEKKSHSFITIYTTDERFCKVKCLKKKTSMKYFNLLSLNSLTDGPIEFFFVGNLQSTLRAFIWYKILYYLGYVFVRGRRNVKWCILAKTSAPWVHDGPPYYKLLILNGWSDFKNFFCTMFYTSRPFIWCIICPHLGYF